MEAERDRDRKGQDTPCKDAPPITPSTNQALPSTVPPSPNIPVNYESISGLIPLMIQPLSQAPRLNTALGTKPLTMSFWEEHFI
jgi:hypothetical protein